MPGALAGVGGFLTGQVGANGVNAVGGGFFGGINQWGNWLCPTGLLPFEVGFHVYKMGMLSELGFSDFAGFHGIQMDDWERNRYFYSVPGPNGIAGFNGGNFEGQGQLNNWVLLGNQQVPSIDETNFLLNRRYITPELARYFYLHNSAGESALATQWEKSRYIIPPISDLIRYTVKDVFDPAVVQTFGYHKEFPIQVLPYAESHGYHGTVGMNFPPGATTTFGPEQRQQPQWIDIDWWAHWDRPSPTQAYEMFFRGYTNSPYGAFPGVNDDTRFELPQLELLLKTADYPEYWRKKFIHIQYSMPTRVDIRRMFDLNLVNDADVYHGYRALGYDNDNSLKLLDFARNLKADNAIAPIRTKVISEIHDLYMMGAIAKPDAQQALIDVRVTFPRAFGYLKVWDMKKKKIEIRDALRVLKSGFLLGTFNVTDITLAMNNMGILPPDRVRYLTNWTREKEGRRKFISARKNEEHFVAGMISRNFFILKLINLNFDNEEIKQMVAFAEYKIFVNYGKMSEKMAKAAAKAAEKQMQLLLKPYSDENIKLFYKKGILDERDIYLIMLLRGWRKGGILNWMEGHLGIDPDDVDTSEATDEENLDEESEGEDVETETA